MPIKIHLGKLLGRRKLRASILARNTGIDKNTLSSLYNQTTTRIKFDTIEKLCHFFQSSVGELLEYHPPYKTKQR